VVADLDTRLRSALRFPEEPGATDETRAAVLAALPRYRARRRLAVAGFGASALGALVIGLVAITGSGAPGRGPTAEALHPGAPSAGQACVEVRIGSGPFACEGLPSAVSGAENASRAEPEQPGSVLTAPSSTAAGLRSVPGRSIQVSLPLTTATWKSVSVVAHDRVVRDVTRIRLVSGRAVATISALPRGSYVITALGVPRCSPEAFCPSLAERQTWTVPLTVRGVTRTKGDK
jgi:hypothetical protein